MIVRGNILFIEKKELVAWPNVLDRVNIINGSCWTLGDFGLDTFYTIAVYISLSEFSQGVKAVHGVIINEKNLNELYYSHIDAMAVVNLEHVGALAARAAPAYAEIRNVCISPSARGQGIARRLVSEIAREIPATYIWLGVDTVNKYWHAALKSYVSCGFRVRPEFETCSAGTLCSPVITSVSPMGTNYGANLLSLWFEKDPADPYAYRKSLPADDEIAKQVKIANTKRTKYLETAGICSEIVKIPANLALKLRKCFVTDPKINIEYGGLLEVRTPAGELGIPAASIQHGSPGQYSVNVPLKEWALAWHTHPVRGLVDMGQDVSVPSNPDMAQIFKYYVDFRMKGHYIFTSHGVYECVLSTHMQRTSSIFSDVTNDLLVTGIGSYFYDMLIGTVSGVHAYNMPPGADPLRSNAADRKAWLDKTDIKYLTYENGSTDAHIESYLLYANSVQLEHLLVYMHQDPANRFPSSAGPKAGTLADEIRDGMTRIGLTAELGTKFSLFHVILHNWKTIAVRGISSSLYTYVPAAPGTHANSLGKPQCHDPVVRVWEDPSNPC